MSVRQYDHQHEYVPDERGAKYGHVQADQHDRLRVRVREQIVTEFLQDPVQFLLIQIAGAGFRVAIAVVAGAGRIIGRDEIQNVDRLVQLEEHRRLRKEAVAGVEEEFESGAVTDRDQFVT